MRYGINEAILDGKMIHTFPYLWSALIGHFQHTSYFGLHNCSSVLPIFSFPLDYLLHNNPLHFKNLASNIAIYAVSVNRDASSRVISFPANYKYSRPQLASQRGHQDKPPELEKSRSSRHGSPPRNTDCSAITITVTTALNIITTSPNRNQRRNQKANPQIPQIIFSRKISANKKVPPQNITPPNSYPLPPPRLPHPPLCAPRPLDNLLSHGKIPRLQRARCG